MDVVTIGESMVLLTPESSGLMRYAASFSRKFGGAETNLATGLARLGHKVGWISKLGDDEFGQAVLSFVRGGGIDASQVSFHPEAPTAIYFKEPYNSKQTRVYYYRSGSAASKMTPADLNEDYISQAKYLHITGITPALSDSCYETTLEAAKIAKKNKVKVVFDPNLRRKLWDDEKAKECLLEITKLTDILLPGLEEAKFLLGEDDPEIVGKRFAELGPSLVVTKLGAKGAHYYSKIEGSGLVSGFPVENVIDPVGAGDGFAAGLLSGLIDGESIPDAITRGNAVGALVTMVDGDVEGLPDRQILANFINNSNEDVAR